MSKVALLICDDALMYATMLSSWLRDDPAIAVVGTAAEAEESVRLAGELRPDVVLLDHLLDGMDSTHLAPRVRDAAPGASIVLTSGASDEMLHQAAEAISADGWVGKAAAFESLRELVLEVAGRPEGPQK